MSQLDNQAESSIILSSFNTQNTKSNELRLKLPLPQFIKDKEVSLANLIMYFSTPNVSPQYANQTVSYIFNGTQVDLTLPKGFYSIEDISGYIQFDMKERGYYLVDQNGNNQYFINIISNQVYYSATLTCDVVPSVLPVDWTNPNNITLSGVSPQLKITNDNFGNLIGFNVGNYPSSPSNTLYSVNSSKTPVISPSNIYNVNLNMVNNSQLSLYPNTIYSFIPNVSYGSQQAVEPRLNLWYPVIPQLYNEIVVTIRDEQGRDIEILDTNMVVTLLFKNKK